MEDKLLHISIYVNDAKCCHPRKIKTLLTYLLILNKQKRKIFSVNDALHLFQ